MCSFVEFLLVYSILTDNSKSRCTFQIKCIYLYTTLPVGHKRILQTCNTSIDTTDGEKA